MTKIVIIETEYKNSDDRTYNAASKPYLDAVAILTRIGARKVLIKNRQKKNSSLLRKVLNRFDISFQALFKLFFIKNKYVFIQYPYVHDIAFRFGRFLKLNNNKIIVLVHDLESLRYATNDNKLKYLLSVPDAIIAHTSNMADWIRDKGYKGIINDLNLFDYLYTENNQENSIYTTNNQIVVFAGNLHKSKFLTQLHKLHNTTTIKFHLWGIHNPEITCTENIKYCGKFKSDDFSYVHGQWGLVWDGDDIYTCSGDLGNYLRYICPYKLCFYLAANLPVIVWKESAMAKFVKDNNIGICINSLEDIQSEVSSITKEIYDEMKKSVSIKSEEIKQGHYLHAALLKCISDLS